MSNDTAELTNLLWRRDSAPSSSHVRVEIEGLAFQKGYEFMIPSSENLSSVYPNTLYPALLTRQEQGYAPTSPVMTALRELGISSIPTGFLRQTITPRWKERKPILMEDCRLSGDSGKSFIPFSFSGYVLPSNITDGDSKKQWESTHFGAQRDRKKTKNENN